MSRKALEYSVGVAVLLAATAFMLYRSESRRLAERRDRERTNANICRSRIQEIHAALVAYRAAGASECPKSLGELFRQGYLSDPSTVICPNGNDDTAFGKTGHQLGASVDAEQKCSFTLIGDNSSRQDAVIVLHERANNHEGGRRHILWSDGRIDLVTEDRFKMLLARQAQR